MLGRPAAKSQFAAWRGQTPKLRTTHAASIAERFRARWLAIGRIVLQDFVDFTHCVHRKSGRAGRLD
jgi:hypothetical protein